MISTQQDRAAIRRLDGIPYRMLPDVNYPAFERCEADGLVTVGYLGVLGWLFGDERLKWAGE